MGFLYFIVLFVNKYSAKKKKKKKKKKKTPLFIPYNKKE